jgi:hypothetical protein
MDKKNPLYQKDYPEYKKILWGAARAFIASFLPVFGLMLSSVTVDDFENKDALIKLGVSVAIASVTAGIVGLGKWIRDAFPESEIAHRLPV